MPALAKLRVPVHVVEPIPHPVGMAEIVRIGRDPRSVHRKRSGGHPVHNRNVRQRIEKRLKPV